MIIACPAGTRRNNNVIVTSKRRRYGVIMTLLSRRVPAGWEQFIVCGSAAILYKDFENYTVKFTAISYKGQ